MTTELSQFICVCIFESDIIVYGCDEGVVSWTT